MLVSSPPGDSTLDFPGSSLRLFSGDEKSSQAFIPLSLARSKLQTLAHEMVQIKSKHLQLVDSIVARYESVQADNRGGFERVLEEVKQRAAARLKENQQLMAEMSSEMAQLKARYEEEHAKVQFSESALQAKNAHIESLQSELQVTQALVKKVRLGGREDSESGLGQPEEVIIQTQTKEIIKQVPDPALQQRIRELEKQFNQLGQENFALQNSLAELEEKNYQLTKKMEKTKENQSKQQNDPEADRRSGMERELASVRAQLEQLRDDRSASLALRINALESDLKPKVSDYSQRHAEFRSDQQKKALESELGLAEVVDSESGVQREMRQSDYEELEAMMEQEAKLSEQRGALTNRGAALKEEKARLDQAKADLSALKDEISRLKSDGASEDEIKSREAEFLDKRNALQSGANQLKAEHAEYTREAGEFKQKEAEMQSLMEKYHINDDRTEGKSRKLSQEHRERLANLIAVNKAKQEERAALKALADEINQKQNTLKQLKQERQTLEIEIKQVEEREQEIRLYIAQMPKAPEQATTEQPQTAAEPSEAFTRRPVKPFVPLQPTVFKDSETIISEKSAPPVVVQGLKPALSRPGTALAFPSLERSGVLDPELQANYDALLVQYKNRSEELSKLKTKMKQLENLKEEELSARQSEIDSLQKQIRILSEGSMDERFAALSNQLENERNSHAESRQKLLKLGQELQDATSQSSAQMAAKEAELAKLQQQIDGFVKPALVRAASRPGTAAGARPLSAGRRQDKERDSASDGASAAQLQAQGQELRELQSAMRDLESELKSKKEEVESLQRAMSGGSEALQHELTSVQARLAELEKERAELREEIEERRRRESENEEARNELVQEIETLRAQAHEDAAQMEARLLAEFNARAAQLEEERTQQVTELNAKLTAMQVELDSEREERIKYQNQFSDAAAERDQWRTESERLKDEQVELAERAKKATSAMDGLQKQIDQRQKIIEEKDNKLAEAEALRLRMESDYQVLVVRYDEEQKRRKEFQFKYEDAKGKIRVYSRVRPFTKAEIQNGEKTLLRPGKNQWTLELNETQRDVMGNVTDKWREFVFDHVFHFGLEGTKGNASQQEVFEETQSFADLSMQGINCCVFAYGQSGTGKTFTMAGVKPSPENNFTEELLGLKPRMIRRVFQLRDQAKVQFDYEVTAYMVEIYLNRLEDLFWKIDQKREAKGKKVTAEQPELKVRVDAKKRVTIDGVTIKKFESAEELLGYMDEAEECRRTRRTGLNEASSRSHLVFAMMLEQTDKKTGKKLKGKLSLVDLAGSERADKTNVDGLSKAQRESMMEEGVSINESLRMLKNVFRILGTQHLPVPKGQKPEIVQYRGNMLTELLQDSLGGSAKTLMFVNVGPAASNISESIDSLQYGDYVKNITNQPQTADEDNTELIRRLKAQVQAYQDKYGEM